MPHAPVSSVPPTPPPAALNRALRRWLAAELQTLRPAIATSAAACGAERYRKHFAAYAHACLLLFHGLSGSPSLRQSYAAVAACPGLAALMGLEPGADAAQGLGVSFSQLAASNTSRPPAFLGALVPALVARVRARGVRVGALPPTLRILDGTFLRLSPKLAPWLGLAARTKRPGVVVQVLYTPALDLPEHLVLTSARTPDVRGLDEAILDDPAHLAALHDHTLAVDLGYYSHKRLAALRAAGVHIVTRLHPQATVVVHEDLPVQEPLAGLHDAAGAERITVQRDQRVTVGSAQNRAGGQLVNLRLVTARVAPTPAAARQGAKPLLYRLLTDRWDLSAAEVVQFYLWRWQIELFLRWLKSHIHLPRLLGYSAPAVALSIWLAVVVHLLSLLATHALGLRRRSPALLRQCLVALLQLTSDALDAVVPPAPLPLQLPLPFAPLPP